MSAASTVTRLDPLPDYGDAHVAPGEHDARVVDYTTWAMGAWRRVVILWRLCDGDIVIPAYYPVKSLSGPARQRGRYRVGTRSRLYRDAAHLLGRRPPIDHIPVDDALGRTYRIEVRDVTQDRDGHDLASSIVYSVVHRVIGRVCGACEGDGDGCGHCAGRGLLS